MAAINRTLFLLAAFVLNLTLVNGWCWLNQFECKNGYCVDFSKRCNHVADCSEGEDEENCDYVTATETPTTTQKPTATPRSTRFPIIQEIVENLESTESTFNFNTQGLNGRGDISDDINEEDNEISYDPYIEVHRNFVEADLDDNITISCQVKGRSKLKTEWFRLGKMPLPENANQKDNGDLEITKVNFENSGFYFCIASDDLNGKSYEKTTFILVNTDVQKPKAREGSSTLKVARAIEPRHRSPAPGNYPQIFFYSQKATTNTPQPKTFLPKAEFNAFLPSQTKIVPCPENYTKDGQCCFTVLKCEPCNSATTAISIGGRTTPTIPWTTSGSTIATGSTKYEYFRCGDKKMIDISKRCNRVNDCQDGSDEYECDATTQPIPGRTCAQNEFTCKDGGCISNNDYCDNEFDCADGSDEEDCSVLWGPKIVELPKFKVELLCVDPSEPYYIPRQALQLECKFVGEPAPKVFWKKYEGTVPAKCHQTTRSGHGVMTCPNFDPSDQGEYSCVAENANGAAESQPKSIAVCSNPITCSGFKVLDEHNIENCLECYCSNKTNECHNIKSGVKIVPIPFPETETEVFLDQKTAKITFVPFDGEYIPSAEIRNHSEPVTYCSVHESILKQNSFVKSYGRNINVPRYTEKTTFAVNAPDLIIRGDGLTLTYSFNKISHTSNRADVRFWRGNWHDLDNNPVNRIQLMRVLAHMDLLLIRCEYDQGETGIWDKSVSIELESASIGDYYDSVSYLERCVCPTGYTGLSCEVCATGYFREEGTNNCVEDALTTAPPTTTTTTTTPLPCPVGYKGEYCDDCDIEKGYRFDQFTGKCSERPCNVNGTMAGYSDPDRCICKTNVVGEFCDQCKEGSFNLNRMSLSGCQSCWCSGVTSDCSSSNYYRSWIASTSYGGYNSSDGRHFWLLPSDFNGNRLTSYGGRLEYRIKFDSRESQNHANVTSLTVEILSQNNETIICKPPKSIKSPISLETSWSVPIEENYWRDRDDKILSRFEILKVLVYVKAIYIESPFHLSSGRANLTSVSLDTVSENPEQGAILAVEVEKCRCPPGYEGLSCESCSIGYTRDKNDRRKCVICSCSSNSCDPETGCKNCSDHTYDISEKGSKEPICVKCPCNGNEKGCYIDDFKMLICECKPGFAGMHCENRVTDINKSQLKVTISPNKVINRRIGTVIVFNCSYDSTEEMIIKFKKVYRNDYGKMDTGFELPSDTMLKTNKFGSMRSLEVNIEDGLKHVECFVFNLLDMEVGRVMATIENTVTNVVVPVITNCYVGSHEIKEGDNLELICEAKGVPPPKIAWFKSVDSVTELQSTDGVYSIENATFADKGKYHCQASSIAGTDSCTHDVVVRSKCLTLDIKPDRLVIEEGESFALTCKASEEGTIEWISPRYRHVIRNGRFTLENATIQDSGNYTCLFNSINGSINKTALVLVEKKRFGPIATIQENDQTIEFGSYFQINCEVSGYPEPVVTWTAVPREALNNVQISNNNRKLLIEGAKKENQGIYECFASSTEGNSSSQISIIVKESSVPPRIRIRPNSVNSIPVGEELDVECVVEEGRPEPRITWSRVDGGHLNGVNFKIINGILVRGLISFPKISLAHSGKYVCIAENSAGKAQASMEIDVLHPPIIEVSPTEVRAFNGDRVEIACEAWANPKPKIWWTEELKSSKRDLGSIDGKSTGLLHQEDMAIKIRALPTIDRYICHAQNILGTVSAPIPFYVQEFNNPPPPEFSKVVEIGSRVTIQCEGVSGKIKWSRLDGSGIENECETSEGLLIPSVQVQHRGTYVCRAVNSDNGLNNSTALFERRITLHVVGFVNRFRQSPKSFMVLPVRPKPKDLKIDITFRPEKANGLLLLEKDTRFFALYMINSKLSLSLNLGVDNTIVIRHNASLKDRKWYTASITITDEYADLFVYGEEGKEIDGLARETIHINYNLSLIKEIYVGGTNITSDDLRKAKIPAIAFDSFDGCVSRFIQNEQEYIMTEKGLHSQDVTLCKVCSEETNPCRGAGGVCFDAPSQYGFVCVCPNGKHPKETSTCPGFCDGFGCDTNKFDFCKLLNPCNSNKHSTAHLCVSFRSSLHCDCAFPYSGTLCEIATEHSFHVEGNGYVKVPANYLVRDFRGRPEVIDIEFTAENNDALLLWQGDASNYLFIGLVQGRIEYHYQNQNIPLKLISSEYISMSSKHRLKAERKNNTVTLTIDNKRQKASADFKTNRVTGDVYLGGMPADIRDNLTRTIGKILPGGLFGCVNFVSLADEKPRINLLEPHITFHNAEKSCTKKNEVDSSISEEDSEELEISKLY